MMCLIDHDRRRVIMINESGAISATFDQVIETAAFCIQAIESGGGQQQEAD